MAARRKIRKLTEPPSGFRCLPEFIKAEEEQRLIHEIEKLGFEPLVMRGYEAKREVAHFGVHYELDGGVLTPAQPIPDFLADLSRRATHEAGFPADATLEALVTRYPPGARIGWHRDAPPFGPAVAGLSLGSTCDFRLRLATPTVYDVYAMRLDPRVLYIISGAARFRWQHMIPPVPALRYSITFRTVRDVGQ